MSTFLNRFKIPTLLGLGIILTGIVGGVLLVLREQGLTLQAAPTATAENIILTNVTEDSAAVSWQTDKAVTSFLTYGQNDVSENTALDDRDTKTPQMRLNHYVTLKNLLPQTVYQFKIFTGKQSSETQEFITVTEVSDQNSLPPVIGSILDGDQPLNEGVAYLSIAGAIPQSALIKTEGSFIIPLAGLVPLDEETSVKLTVISDAGEASLSFYLKDASTPLPPLKIGQALDLRDLEKPIPTPPVSEDDLNKFDLNDDGLINANDHAIVLQNFGKNPKNKKADLYGDGVVDQKDLDLISKHINQ